MSKIAFALVLALVLSMPALFDALNHSVSLNFADGYLSGEQQPGLEAAATFRLFSLSGGNGTSDRTS